MQVQLRILVKNEDGLRRIAAVVFAKSVGEVVHHHWGCTIPSMCDTRDCAPSRCDTAISLRHGFYTHHTVNIKDILYCMYE